MKEDVGQHDVAECVLRLGKELSFDLVEYLPPTSRFVIVDDYEIRGGGIIREVLKDKTSRDRENIRWRNYNWKISHITPEKRAERYNQRSILVLLTGQNEDLKKEIAKRLEEQLFHEGKLVYFLGLGNFLRGVNADLHEEKKKFHREHIRRLAEVAHIFLDAGLILIVTINELNYEELQLIKLSVNPTRMNTIWVGEDIETGTPYDMMISDDQDIDDTIETIKEHLREQQIIFRPF
jgi:bifunctional enzyme CysN/CysC